MSWFWATVAMQNGPDHAFCKWIIGGLAGFVVTAGYGAYSWIKAILQELKEERAGRLNDLKEHYKTLADEKGD